MSKRAIVCRESATGRHVVGAENIGRDPLRATCIACRKPVERAHRKSPWWWSNEDTNRAAIDAPPETPKR